MKPEVKEAWVGALRSGTYEQGQFSLREGDTFCCLGVLCDLSGVAEWENLHDPDVYGYDGNACSLPASVEVWAGIREDEVETVDRLIGLNDRGDGQNFDTIADYIEENL